MKSMEMKRVGRKWRIEKKQELGNSKKGQKNLDLKKEKTENNRINQLAFKAGAASRRFVVAPNQRV